MLSANVATGHAIATQNGGTDTVFSANVPLGAVGEHSVTITTGTGGGFFIGAMGGSLVAELLRCERCADGVGRSTDADWKL
jgi:hypothetical protein